MSEQEQKSRRWEHIQCRHGVCIDTYGDPDLVGTSSSTAGRFTVYMPLDGEVQPMTLACECEYGRVGLSRRLLPAKAVLDAMLLNQKRMLHLWSWAQERPHRAAMFNHTMDRARAVGVDVDYRWHLDQADIPITASALQQVLGRAGAG